MTYAAYAHLMQSNAQVKVVEAVVRAEQYELAKEYCEIWGLSPEAFTIDEVTTQLHNSKCYTDNTAAYRES